MSATATMSYFTTYLTVLHIIAALLVFARGFYLVGQKMNRQTDWRIRACVSSISGSAPFTLFYPPAVVVCVVSIALLLFIDRRIPESGI